MQQKATIKLFLDEIFEKSKNSIPSEKFILDLNCLTNKLSPVEIIELTEKAKANRSYHNGINNEITSRKVFNLINNFSIEFTPYDLLIYINDNFKKTIKGKK